MSTETPYSPETDAEREAGRREYDAAIEAARALEPNLEHFRSLPHADAVSVRDYLARWIASDVIAGRETSPDFLLRYAAAVQVVGI